MKVITYFKSKTGTTKCNYIIYNDNVSVKSQSSLILLNEYFRERDVDYLKSMMVLQNYLNKRHIFLLKTKKTEGDLVCHYCNKKHLEIGFRSVILCNANNDNKNLATIDHVVPVSSGIDPLDESNWVISCKKCNTEKGDMDYNKFKNKKELV
jgi:5-methylcytosine-specific restriction endonuclease McrA